MRYILFILLFFICFSCIDTGRNFNFDENARLHFSNDTVFFDTVFTTIGSSIQYFKIYNPHKSSLLIERIELAGGDASPFRINIDGEPVTRINNYALEGGDSIFIILDVTIDPAPGNMPFVVKDSVIFISNGNYQDVKLIAWGQNAIFLRNERIDCDVTWTNQLPYVIFDSVLIDAGCRLTIKEGTRIYSHHNAVFWVAGTLKVEGSIENPVIFTGDRLENYYKDIPHQWFGIRFLYGSTGNNIKNAVIRNAAIGLLVDSMNYMSNFDKFIIENTIIENMSNIGILAINSHIDAKNLVINNCGQHLMVGIGGNYNLRHCTFANYNFMFSRRSPSLIFSNYNIIEGARLFVNDLKIISINNIIWGSLEEEIEIGNQGGGLFELSFSHNLIRTLNNSFQGNNNIINHDPRFEDPKNYKYQLNANSSAINAGVFLPDADKDITGKPRGTQPDLGAYEAD